MKITEEFCPADRYRYDFGLCSINNGFAQIDSGQDAWCFGTWAHLEKLIIFNYCEGDCTTTQCDNLAEFEKEIRSMKQWNDDQGYSFGIDPGLDQGHVAAWKNAGMGDLLH